MAASAARTVISWTDDRDNDHQGELVARAHDLDVIACEVCGFRHTVPLPQPKTVERNWSGKPPSIAVKA